MHSTSLAIADHDSALNNMWIGQLVHVKQGTEWQKEWLDGHMLRFFKTELAICKLYNPTTVRTLQLSQSYNTNTTGSRHMLWENLLKQGAHTKTLSWQYKTLLPLALFCSNWLCDSSMKWLHTLHNSLYVMCEHYYSASRSAGPLQLLFWVVKAF